MKKEVLIKLFSPEKQISIIATVQKRISGDLYQLIDDSGRLLQARGSISGYPNDRVIVQNQIIISAIGNGKEVKTFMV
jgi:hypothetical protein